jgi:hypothetical protein
MLLETIFSAYKLPVMPTPPVTCIAPVEVLVLVVALVISNGVPRTVEVTLLAVARFFSTEG